MSYGGDRDRHTICAVSTPSGFGGVAVIRVSGPQAFEICRKIAGFLPNHPESHKIYFGTLATSDGRQAIDEVLASCFHHGKSYTGEETVEISCHGSPAITQWILQELVSGGARIAERGEFSYRAFINGKIDLVQAEGVLELVESQSQRSAKQGLRQLKGGLSHELRSIQGEVLHVLGNIEAAIDFSTEDIEVINKKELLSRVERAQEKLNRLLATYEAGRLLVDGLQVVLTGAPNVGKSSLFNLLVQEDRSIVTELPGTTRDVVEASVLLDGIRARFFDTAGVRESLDVVEKLGIERTRQSQSSADVILFLFDASAGLSPEDLEILRNLELKKLILVGNKSDRTKNSTQDQASGAIARLIEGKIFKTPEAAKPFTHEKLFFISTLEHKFRDTILSAIKNFLKTEALEDEAVISQARHFDNLHQASQLIGKSAEGLKQNLDAEFVALDLKEALVLLQETLGERFDDQIMDFVFNQFCIGK